MPIEQTAVYLRLQKLKEEGHADAEKEGGVFYWSLTERGRESLEGFDFSPADETNSAVYFAGRTMTLSPVRVLEAIAPEDDEWLKISTLFDKLDFSKDAV